MEKVQLFNTRRVGGPSITLPIPGRDDVTIPAEGDPKSTKGELIKGAKGVVVEADLARLQKQAAAIRGLKVQKVV